MTRPKVERVGGPIDGQLMAGEDYSLVCILCMLIDWCSMHWRTYIFTLICIRRALDPVLLPFVSQYRMSVLQVNYARDDLETAYLNHSHHHYHHLNRQYTASLVSYANRRADRGWCYVCRTVYTFHQWNPSFGMHICICSAYRFVWPRLACMSACVCGCLRTQYFAKDRRRFVVVASSSSMHENTWRSNGNGIRECVCVCVLSIRVHFVQDVWVRNTYAEPVHGLTVLFLIQKHTIYSQHAISSESATVCVEFMLSLSAK